VKSSVLVDPWGNRVSISAAVPGVPYLGLDGDFVATHPRWGVAENFSSSLAQARPQWEPGYEQGGAAGTLLVTTNDPGWYIFDPDLPKPKNPSATGAVRVFDGTVAASVVVGPKQRELPTGSTDPTRIWREEPAGATLGIDRAGDVTIASAAPQLAGDFGPDSALDPSLLFHHLLPAGWFDGSTFRFVSIKSGYDPDETQTGPGANPGTTNRAPGGHLAIGAGVVVDLGDGGSFSFTGKAAEIDGTLLAPGGKVTLTALQTGGDGAAAVQVTGIIDVAGRLSNDRLDGATVPLQALNGGSVSLTAATVSLDDGSLIDVSGGARLVSHEPEK
jgi:hypothetical protein